MILGGRFFVDTYAINDVHEVDELDLDVLFSDDALLTLEIQRTDLDGVYLIRQVYRAYD